MSQVFDAYSEYYDLLYTGKNYAQEAKYVASLIESRCPKSTTVLDLGCGTGAHAEQLAKLGYTVHGIDLSPGMLRKAEQRKKALPQGISDRLSFSLGDVRDFRDGSTYDVVISLFHVMSYQCSNQNIRDTLQTASSHLTSGGLFVFDYWYGPAVLSDKPQVRVKRLENKTIRILRIAEPIILYEKNVVEVNYTVQVDEKESGTTTQLVEKHEMRYLFLPEIESFSEPQFRKIDHLNWMSLEDQPSDLSWSALSILAKD